MSETAATTEPTLAPKNLLSRLVGVVVSPADTFKSIVAHPKWLGAVLTVAILIGGGQFAFLSTEVGRQASLDQQIQTMENFGVKITPEMQQGMEAGLSRGTYITVVAILVMSFVMTAILAGIGYGVFTGLMGGAGTFKQVMAVVAHAGAVSLLGQIFTIPLNYVRESMSSATNLSVFLPFLDEGSVLARFFGMIDIFIIWWLVVLAIGLGILYRRKTGPIFASLAGVYVVIAAVAAVVMRAIAGSQ
jgi:hypothetical protein